MFEKGELSNLGKHGVEEGADMPLLGNKEQQNLQLVLSQGTKILISMVYIKSSEYCSPLDCCGDFKSI